ncbi:protein STAY-GREEN homolog, chloroplastic [Andrographis paniculata]|uniref:protein STAY-GREEN homolog, chloroplastic n=1 Tax=Andrographis paniculata TaxID=175694 RepID=UPI0021E71E7D|nr:protein STAY-GREEN homolog, chloroplastic [Andrographis paniculata]
MGTIGAALLLPTKLKPERDREKDPYLRRTRRRRCNSNNYIIRTRNQPQTLTVAARLFGPAIFEASKLKVLFLGVDEKKHPGKLPRTYTLTHSDITSKLTLAISQTINNSQLQGWYNRLQRDEVVAEWKKIKGMMSLHVHCHISGGHPLLDFFANLRYFIFCKELPVVLKAFVHGDGNLLSNYPELQDALVWVYFHSSIPHFNKVQCWGPLRAPSAAAVDVAGDTPQPCAEDCNCCFPPMSSVPDWPQFGSPAPPQENEGLDLRRQST